MAGGNGRLSATGTIQTEEFRKQGPCRFCRSASVEACITVDGAGVTRRRHVQAHRSAPARPRLLLCRTVGQAGVMGDSSLRPFLPHRGGERRAGHGGRRPAAWQACGSGQPSLAQLVRYSSHRTEIVHIPFRRLSVIGAAIVASPRATG
jgi:hypothetical protein